MGRIRVIVLSLASVACICASFFLDATVHAWVAAHTDVQDINVARTISRFGAWQWLMLAMALAAVFALIRGKKSALPVIGAMVLVSSISGLTGDVLHSSIGRARPNSSLTAAWYGPAHFGDTRYASFPSGHASASAGLIGPLLILRRRVGLVLLTVPLVIGCARIVVNAHYFSDVLAGYGVGAVVTAAWWRWQANSKSALPTNLR